MLKNIFSDSEEEDFCPKCMNPTCSTIQFRSNQNSGKIEWSKSCGHTMCLVCIKRMVDSADYRCPVAGTESIYQND